MLNEMINIESVKALYLNAILGTHIKLEGPFAGVITG